MHTAGQPAAEAHAPRPIAPPRGGAGFAIRTARLGDEDVLSDLTRRLVQSAYRAGDPLAVATWAAQTYSAQAIRARILSASCQLIVCVDAAGTIHGSSFTELRRGPHGADSLLGGTYLSREARGQGLMVQTYPRMVDWLQRNDARRVLAYVHAGNARGRTLLEVIGFTHRAEVPGALVPGMRWCEMTADVPRRR